MIAANCCQSEILPENDNPGWLRSLTEVSVIIPTYNREDYLGEAIQSVLDQTFRNFELIIVDDGSTDNTRKVVRNFSDARIRYIYQENGGVSSARNTGIKASNGKYIAFLDSDDLWLPNNLEVKVNLLDSRVDISLVCSDAFFISNHNGTTIGRRWHDRAFHDWIDPQKAERQPLKQLIARGCFITPQASVMRRLVFDRVGYFDETLRTHEDWDMFIRVVRFFSVATIDTPLLKIRRHDRSLSASWDKMYLGAVTVLNKAQNKYTFSGNETRLLKRRLARTHSSYGKSLILNGELDPGREKLLTAIKVNPLYLRPYLYLIGALLGDKVINIMKSCVKAFKKRQTLDDSGLNRLMK